METPQAQEHFGGDDHPAGAGALPGAWSMAAIVGADPSSLAALLGRVAVDQLDFDQGVAVLTGAGERGCLLNCVLRFLLEMRNCHDGYRRTRAAGGFVWGAWAGA
ncbi:hypothetical protein [Paenarthrobacter sp. PH39-S1]|uniref:hypothetical protein n=1 Tax=Paenarthrobacter sp. PH39-S1 TaxID=3046204 RepID=UPI0024BAAA9B|nr:hypothetical protein [Paenarthrobacter sp. PH39-S1]MDJ0355388.1 hypothetical protein [Paenarthrobacter sp. PH39-S1]